MSDSDQETFEASNSGAADTFPLPANDLRVGSYIMLKNFPCRVVSVDHVKTGKHGHAKVVLTGIDIFTQKKYEDSFPASHSVQSFTPKKLTYQVIDIKFKQLSLLDDDNNVRNDLDLPEDNKLTMMIQEAFEKGESVIISVLSAIGIEQIVERVDLRPSD